MAARLDTDRGTARRWRTRFLQRRLDGLSDEPRPGAPRIITDAQVEEVVVRTLEEVPQGAPHWSKRELARRVGISPTRVCCGSGGPLCCSPGARRTSRSFRTRC
ncbi:helix-turn-helix domain-containing protein [Streptomyces olindensis]|uniref:Helix-turn-helix domain-containing protein n=1 Tax=Streptomyces olindensis TaxID=358823 RepID=A0ABV2XWV0_9ACTN